MNEIMLELVEVTFDFIKKLLLFLAVVAGGLIGITLILAIVLLFAKYLAIPFFIGLTIFPKC